MISHLIIRALENDNINITHPEISGEILMKDRVSVRESFQNIPDKMYNVLEALVGVTLFRENV